MGEHLDDIPDRPAREIGSHDGGLPGPCLVVIGGLHGNERAGVGAFERVRDTIVREGLALRGKLIGIVGNRKGYARDQRFIVRDLNRSWHPEILDDLLGRAESELENEDREQRELLEFFIELEERHGACHFLDLHSTSGEGAPFACMSDTLRNRRLGMALRVPLILGLEEAIDGSMLGYLCDRGHVTVAFEGGQHTEPTTLEHMESAIWLSLEAAGLLRKRQIPGFDEHRRQLRRAARGVSPVVEIRHREVITSEDEFRMEPGFRGFDRIHAGQLLAHNRRGPIHAGESGRILMPLYQGQGEDGFFLVRRVRPFWLRLSGVLRRIGAARLIPLLPGVREHPERPDHYLVDRRIARFLVVEIFHLFGFRRRRPEGETVEVFSRRSPEESLRRSARKGVAV